MIKRNVLFILCLAQSCCAASKLRNPFSCSHDHGTVTSGQAKVTETVQEPQYAKQTSVADTVSSEWHVIAEKDSTVIMQHRDGSIREITLGKK